MLIAIPLFDRFTALDAVGPYEVLSRLPGAEVTFVAEQAGPVRTDTARPDPRAERALADVDACDVLVVPGGPGTREMLEPQPLHDWLRAIDATTSGRRRCAPASLSWAPPGCSTASRPPPTGRRSTRWRASAPGRQSGGWCRRARSSPPPGVSAGIDMALWLAGQIAGDEVAKAIQLGIEYDPQPPFDSGSVAKASPETKELVRLATSSQPTTRVTRRPIGAAWGHGQSCSPVHVHRIGRRPRPRRRLVAGGQLPVRRPDLPARQPAAARAPDPRPRQAAAARSLGHDTRAQPPLCPSQPGDPGPRPGHDVRVRAGPRRPGHGRQHLPRGQLHRAVPGGHAGRGRDEATVPPVLLPGRRPQPRRPRDARIDQRGWRAGLLPWPTPTAPRSTTPISSPRASWATARPRPGRSPPAGTRTSS